MSLIHKHFTSVVQILHKLYDVYMTNQEIENYLKLLGFSDDAIDVYYALIKHGSMNLSDLSRVSKVERTNLYRNLPILEHDGLIQVDSSDGRRIVHLAPISNIERLISLKRRKMARIEFERTNFLNLVEITAGKKHSTETRFYRGIEPMKQAILSAIRLNSKSSLFYTVAPYSIVDMVGTNFLASLDVEVAKQKVKQHIISNVISENTKVEDKKLYTDLANIDIEQYFMVFQDRVTYFYWKDLDPYAFEIMDKHIAKTNIQMLELMIGKSI